ncbi:MAG: hypothetical protein ACETVZ_00415 [Phycisphaerae bacterium]
MRTTLVAAVTIAIAVSFAAGLFVGGIMERSHRISNRAAIKAIGVGVYQDPELTVPLTEINWGILEPGEEKNQSAYIKNESNVPVTLVLTTENWSPQNASSFIALTWDYDGQLLGVDGFVEVTFTLAVDPTISGIDTFSFDIVIVGTG